MRPSLARLSVFSQRLDKPEAFARFVCQIVPNGTRLIAHGSTNNEPAR